MNTLILDYGQNPTHWGKLEHYDVRHREVNTNCGEELDLDIRFGEGDVVEDLAFEAEGRMVTIASMSLLADTIEGKPLSFLDDWTKEDVLEMLELETLSDRRLQSALLGLLALKNVAREQRGEKALTMYDLL